MLRRSRRSIHWEGSLRDWYARLRPHAVLQRSSATASADRALPNVTPNLRSGSELEFRPDISQRNSAFRLTEALVVQEGLRRRIGETPDTGPCSMNGARALFIYTSAHEQRGDARGIGVASLFRKVTKCASRPSGPIICSICRLPKPWPATESAARSGRIRVCRRPTRL